MNFSLSESSHVMTNGHLTMTFNEHNILQAIKANSVMFNLYEPTEFELALSNIYLRVKQDNTISYTPLMSYNSDMRTFRTADGLVGWETTTAQFRARVTASLATDNNTIYYTADIENLQSEDITFDLIFGQDIALADEGAVKSNECYVSQYLDHQVFSDDTYGYVVCSRQNLPQSSGNPCSQIGAFSKVVGFSTDGYQFFGKNYRFDNKPTALSQPDLENVKFQFEMGYVALQTEETTLSRGETSQTVFYMDYQDHLADSNVSEAGSVDLLINAYQAPLEAVESEVALPSFLLNADATLSGEALSSDEIDAFFGKTKRFEEHKNDELLSFFYSKEAGESRYVTLPAKERHLERSTGHMISSGNNQDFNNAVMSSTHGMYGVFNSHVVLGNTSFNKLIGVDRTSLNLYKFSGQRIWVLDNGEYRVLTMPSAYESSANFSRWIYKYQQGYIQVTSFSAQNAPTIQLDIELINLDQPLEISVTSQLIMGNNEKDSNVTVARESRYIHVTGDNALVAGTHPELTYTWLAAPELDELSVIKSGESVRYMLLKGSVRKKASITITGALDAQSMKKPKVLDFATETKLYQKSQNKLINNFTVEFENDRYNSQKLNDTIQWFTHNALVHYSTPHGLEQYSGAAWGTRDVSQGPFELFMSMQHFDKAAELLKNIYSHQHIETGTWPQWFMFDKYSKIQQEDCHGDIVVWPLKAIADYITTTGDLSILDQSVPYTSIEDSFEFTKESYTLFAHIERQVKHIIDNLIPGTHLSCYGDGDWDDTLQPANQALRENMVSGWTIPLTLQAMKTLSSALNGAEAYAEFVAQIQDLTEKMEADYHRFLIKDGVIAGFIHFPDKDVDQVEYLLHPSDKKTGINYRLLPASRSIISETFDKEMAEAHMNIIQEKLVYPDGVRLMEKMAEYNAGKQSYFKRAELAANLGREVGLQYCHAHIRFIEALCKMGKADDVFDNLYKIVPVGIQKSVPNADVRQSNAYFSSSDGKFNDRYEAYDNFDKLKSGEVEVKGGWRIYSSGPGIYINQLISSVLGIRYQNEALVLDPIIAKSLGKVTLNFSLYDKPCQLVIHPEEGCHTPKRVELNDCALALTELSNAYRTGGVLVEKYQLINLLGDNLNKLEIWL
ncbi:GH36-type glycosyl hydrolase domain-containing protein [Photobacterium sp. OFAV2-7]|uniref:GH36-type glycosyl hydrolase domain-containing protein n=1 Tax=Photobacterium sp. OFAV2-7 TaxID=2917748 RepID=UPI001EF45FC8|nr:cellobiose phosphorylase [Photobacterium sp. OFAV2-7]MCG7585552.1 cellobiose phosphorylase [Photobacterium sp. OFAV2-7]